MAGANDLPFEQRSAVWTLFYATKEGRRRVLQNAIDHPRSPGSNAEPEVRFTSLKATNQRVMTAHRVTKAGLRRGLDDLVTAKLANRFYGKNSALSYALTPKGRALVGEPR